MLEAHDYHEFYALRTASKSRTLGDNIEFFRLASAGTTRVAGKDMVRASGHAAVSNSCDE